MNGDGSIDLYAEALCSPGGDPQQDLEVERYRVGEVEQPIVLGRSQAIATRYPYGP